MGKPAYKEQFRLLTDRERQVLRMLAQGMTDREAAAALKRSPHTITAHIRHICVKMGILRRTALVAEAVRAGVA